VTSVLTEASISPTRRTVADYHNGALLRAVSQTFKQEQKAEEREADNSEKAPKELWELCRNIVGRLVLDHIDRIDQNITISPSHLGITMIWETKKLYCITSLDGTSIQKLNNGALCEVKRITGTNSTCYINSIVSTLVNELQH